jgi:hypothetical protein
MLIDIKQIGSKQVRTYQTKIAKKDLQEVVADVLKHYKSNKTITIKVEE